MQKERRSELLNKLVVAGITRNLNGALDAYCELATLFSNEFTNLLCPISSPEIPAIIVAVDTISKEMRRQNPAAAKCADDILNDIGVVAAVGTDDGIKCYKNGEEVTGETLKIFDGIL